jgi:methyl-accepting chemotaxis protein
MSIHRDDIAVLAAIGLVWAGTLGYAFAGQGLGLAFGVGALVMAAAAAVASMGTGPGTRAVVAALGMAMVALLIHVARGRAEAHFAVFAFLAVTMVYRHWLPVVAAAGAIAVHHLSFNYFQQWGWGPVCFTEPGLGRVLEHAAYVVAEAGILVLLAQRARAEFAAGDQLNRIAERLAGSDGSIDLAVGDMKTDVPAVRKMVESLARIEGAIAAVKATSQSIATASDEIAAGSQDLSHRTEQTASSLQQTASAVDQLNGAVTQSAASARSANERSALAASVAEQGGAVVAQVVQVMEEINDSSKRIADIIGTIDGIAFQTNILALNAAVEAARAGEQGRGFAVVAGEVRSLAQRSAEAAREIKGLIGTSVERVEQGARLVDNAGRAMDGIVSQVRRVSDLIGEISSATQEQSSGISQVSQAVGHLDQITQQNAALVEQGAAASESLRVQSARLTEAVGVFR